MSKQDSKSHGQAVDLLPWYVNKTLPAAQHKKVEAHVGSCSECQNEVAALRRLESAVISTNEELPAPSAVLMDRVMSRVDAYEHGRARAKGTSVWERLAGFGFTLPRLAMAQLAAIVLLAGTVGITAERAARFQSMSVEERRRADSNQAALVQEREKLRSLAESCAQLSTDLVKIKVAFNENASEKQIRELLAEVGGSISAGPSAQNFCTVAITVPPSSRRSEVADGALARLRGNRRVVVFAEVLP